MTTNNRLAEIAPAVPFVSVKSSSVYTYTVPARAASAIAIGSTVTVPLGRQRVSGTVLRLHTEPVSFPTKPLVLHKTPPLTSGQITFARWVSTTMHGSLGYTLRLFFPPAGLPAEASAKAGAPSHLPATTPTLHSLLVEKSDATRYRQLADWLEPAAQTKTQALIIVPELRFLEPLRASLTKTYDNVITYASEYSAKELGGMWRRIYAGESLIVIGTQKALFLPWRNLSHVVLEEEFLDTHKLWDQYPRLDNRDGARQLAVLQRSHLLYAGSALSLARAADLQLNQVQVLSVKPVTVKPQVVSLSFTERSQRHLLPPDAVSSLKASLRQGERVLLLHNQRGTWRTAFCSHCRQVLRCPNCSSTMFVTGSSKGPKVQCRECTYNGSLPTNCPNCQKKGLRVFGPGATRISHILETLLPKASVLEIHAGSSVSAAQLEAANIIIGTTAIWRHTAGVQIDRALWLFPESTLLYPDYRSSERALTLLAQLQHLLPARRRVMVVTRYGQLIEQALATPADKITARLLRERARLHYPPYASFVRLTCYGRSEATAIARGREVRERLDAARSDDVRVRGPYQGFNKKEDGHFAAHLLLSGPLEKLIPLYKDLPINRADLSPAQIL